MVEESPMSERENILARVREALKVKAHAPGAHSELGETMGERRPEAARQWLPRAGGTFDEQIAQFRQATLDLKADFQLLASAEELRRALVSLRDAEGWKRAACHSGELPDAICPVLNLPLLRTDRPYEVRHLETCDVG